LSAFEGFFAEVMAENSQAAQEGWLDSIKLKILDNIKVKISEIHIRMEHYIAQPGQEVKQSASFGILLRNF
jgi:hypothetical protein